MLNLSQALSFKATEQKVNSKYFEGNKDLNTEITFKIDNDDIIFKISIGSIIYTYLYNRNSTEFMKISLWGEENSLKEIDSKAEGSIQNQVDEVKRVKDIDPMLDGILNNLKAVAFSNIRLNLTLTKNTDNLILAKVNTVNNELKINKNKIEDSLQECLINIKPNSLDKLAFTLYLNCLGLSLAQHESLK